MTIFVGDSRAEKSSPRKEPNAAVLVGRDRDTEFDAALQKMNLKYKKFEDSDAGWKQLEGALGQYNIILTTPGLSTILPHASGVDEALRRANALMAFVEKGGVVVQTGATDGGQLEWLQLADKNLEVSALQFEKKPKDDYISTHRPGETAKSLMVAPRRVIPIEPLQYHFKTLPEGKWEPIAHRTWGPPLILAKRFGKGLVVISALRHPEGDLLENTLLAFRLQELGLQFGSSTISNEWGKRWEKNVVIAGPGQASASFKNIGVEATPVRGFFRLDNGVLKREVFVKLNSIAPEKAGTLSFPFVADLRGRTRVEFGVEDTASGGEIAVYSSEVILPDFMTVVPPGYRGLISTARRDRNVHFKMRFSSINEPVENLPLQLVIMGPNGNVVSTKRMTAVSAEFLVDMELPLNAPEGVYTIAAEALRHGVVREVAETTFKIIPVRKGQLMIDQDSSFLKDGKPFFPIGIYHVTPSQIDEVAGVGFNMIQFWSQFATPENLTRLEQKGMHIMWEGDAWAVVAHHNGPGVLKNPRYLAALEKQRVAAQEFKNHSAMGMWYVADEPPIHATPSLQSIMREMHKSDEDHPTYLVSLTGDYDRLADACDVLGVDPYPVYLGGRRPLSIVSNAVEEAHRAVDYRKPIIGIPQAFGDNLRHNEKPEEVRAITYLYLTHGVKGLVWYCWKETGDNSGAEGAGNHPATIKVLKELVAELKVVSPALMEPGARKVRSTNGRVHGIICGSKATGRYVLFVNEEYEPTDVSIDVPELAGARLKGLFNAPAAKIQGSKLQFKAEALATGVYEIQ